MSSEAESPAATLSPPPGDRASALIEGSLDCIVTIDPHGDVVEFNPMAEQVLGWSAAEAIGRNLTELLIPEEHVAAHRAGLARYLGGVESTVVGRRLELPVLTRSGERLSMELMVVAVDNDGRLEFTAFMRDVTELRRAQAELAASQQRFEALVRHSTHALILDQPDTGESLFLGSTAPLGYEYGSPLPGRGGFLSLVHPDDLEAARELLALLRARRGSESPQSTVDLRLRRSDGEWITGQVTGEDLTHVPAVAGHLLRVADVTLQRAQRRQLADVTAQMRTLIEHLSSGILFEDTAGRVLVANQAMVDLFGVPLATGDLIGTHLPDSVHLFEAGFSDPEAFVEDVRQCFAGGSPRLGSRFARRDGRTLERDYLPVVVDGGLVGHLWVFRDVTESIAYERVLEDQNRALAELAEMKNEFVARASHELRSPLTSVVSFTEIIASLDAGPLTDEQAQYVEVVMRNAQRLLRLIEDLLLMTKLESHTLSLSVQELDLSDLTAEVVSELGPRAVEAGIDLTFDGPAGATVRGDAVRLQQVVSNIVGNAIAYTPSGGRIEVSLTRGSDGWRLDVADTGVGVRAEELPRLFDAFYRASTAAGARATKGSGLGLSIVRLIVDLHGGSVSVDSTPGAGTTMTVLLPSGGA